MDSLEIHCSPRELTLRSLDGVDMNCCLKYSGQFDRLEKLDISMTTNDAYVPLFKAPNLTHLRLTLQQSCVVDKYVDYWGKLRSLAISSNTWNLIGVFHLITTCCPLLEELELKSESNGYYPIYYIQRMSNLQQN